MLEIYKLTKHFGDTLALDELSFDVKAGEMVGIVGRSGAGKSTLLRTINRLNSPSSGHILYNEIDVTTLKGSSLRHWRRRCAMIFQQFNLVNRLDVMTNVLVGRVAHRNTFRTLLKAFNRRERALAALTLERVGMAEQILQRADTLSGGQQQRIAIARALVQEPEVVLADEPIASLDPHNAALVMSTLRDINQVDGKSVIVNVHNVDIAREYCDRIIGMRAGRIVFDGPPSAFTNKSFAKIYETDQDGVSGPENTAAARSTSDGQLAATVT